MLSVFQRKISAVKDAIATGDFDGAASKLELLGLTESMAVGQIKKIRYLRLKVFNRLQWLIEGSAVVVEFQDCQDILAEEYLEIALFYVLSGQIEQAECFMRQAMALDKRSVLFASELAILFEQQGEREKALAIYNKILASMLARNKIDAVGARVLNRLAGLRSLDDAEIIKISSLCSKYADGELGVRLLFGLSKCYSKVADINSEIACLEKANRLADQLNECQLGAQTVETSRLRLRAIRLLFDEAAPSWMPDYPTSDQSPVFILGMPRSGTTLLEQILGAHSSIGNAGESRAMGIAFKRRLLNKATLPEDKGSDLPFLRYKTLDQEDGKAIIDYYDRYQALFSDKAVITDKELSNIDRVGIILRLYPKAKFICVKRHPLDVCASIMQQDFSIAYFSASSIKIAKEYEIYYDKAMHWQNIFPRSMITIEYETLVSDFEKTTLKLMDFLGLPWEDAISRFYERGNSVRTPSLSQVRSPINSMAIGKWMRYRKLLQPAEDYLVAQGLLLEPNEKI